MTKTIYQNEQRKREFLEHLKGAEGFANSSLNTFAEAIYQWQFFTGNEDFINFNKSKALAFRDWLNSREAKTETGTIGLVTQYNYLRRVKRFFKWLADQPLYKNKILKNDVEFLRLSKKDARVARQGTTRQMPTFEEAKAIIENIEIKSEIDKRDRALICFALITGMRISAIVTLKMKNFDAERKLIDQNPGDGVKTKNSKRILTTFFPIGWDEPERYFMEWFNYLWSKGFRPNDPVFPATMGGFAGKEHQYSKESVGAEFWSGTGGARKIFEKRCKNADLPYFNPHSFRHLVVIILSKTRLTEEEKKAISLNLGHSNIGTTFGSYGYGSMNDEEAVAIVQKLKAVQDSDANGFSLSEEEKAVFERIMKKVL
jgi:integrase/recombinase XerD